MGSNQTKEKLLAEIERLKKELKKKKKYGLVWEDKPEDVVEMCKEKLPVLKEIKSKEIITDKNKPVNLLIEGDNYHALSVLNYTHKGKIDAIYIDPPYNTGKEKEWKYNDKYVDKNDGYRHSKWLNMMEKRLTLAKNLLTKDGVIFISINDNEYSQLKLLLDFILREENFIDNFIIRSNPRGNQAKKFTASEHEYLICYAKNIKLFKPLGFIKNKNEYNKKDKKGIYREMGLRKRGAGARRIDAPNQYYPIYFNVKTEEIDIKRNCDRDVEILPKLSDGSDGRWRWSYKSVLERRESLLIRLINRNGKKVFDVFEKDYFRINKISKIKTIFYEKDVNYENATEELKEIFNSKVFEYPKPVYLIYKLLESLEGKSQTILDFFAGSGTTGQAVLKLNKKDGGNRKFILCTNNENDICEEVTFPRILKVINGYKFKGNDKKILFQKKFTYSQLEKIDEIIQEMNDVIEKNKSLFDKIEKKFEDNTIKIIGVKNINDKKEGLSGNLKYFKTDFVDYKESTDKNKIKLTKEATEMLCVKEGTFESVTANDDFKIFKNQDHYAGIIFDQLAIKDFKKAIKDIKGKISVYIFSLGDDSFEDEFEDIKQKVKLSPIPEAILKVYRRIFK